MDWWKVLLVFVPAFGLGAVLGPLLSAAIAGLSPVKEPGVPLAGAMRLLDAYEARVPADARPAGPSWEAAARRCGYDPRTVVDAEAMPGADWTPYTGYFDLRMWQGSEARAELRADRAGRLARAMTPFQQGFYRECMMASVFAPLCQRQVSAMLADTAQATTLQAASATAPELRSEETICHFLDGVAARRGLPLAIRAGVALPPAAEPEAMTVP